MQGLGNGYVQVYSGDGKGKTTAALGQALRAAGCGLKSFILQFMKDFPYGEIKSIGLLHPWIAVEQYGNDVFVMDRRRPSADDFAAARRGLGRARAAMTSGEYDIVILDEICVAIHYGLIEKATLLRFLQERPRNVELILTGRYCPQEVMEAADLVTEMKEVKHYYQKGVVARTGIEN